MKIGIVGAGPLGSFAAWKFGKNNDITLFEQKKKITSKHSGIFSTNILNYYKPPKNIILNKVKGAVLKINNKEAIIKDKKIRAIVVNSQKFDENLFNEAKKVSLYKNEKIEKVDLIGKGVRLNNYSFDFVIGADGPFSKLSKNLGIRQKNIFYGLETIADCNFFDKKLVELYFEKKFSDFFAWIIPLNDSEAKIGVICKTHAQKKFSNFLKFLQIKKHRKIIGGAIPIGFYENFIFERLVLIGDAAGQVKSTTGGGITLGMKSVNLLFKLLKNQQYCLSKKCLVKNYYPVWKKEIGKELWLHWRIRKFLNKLNDRDYEELIELANTLSKRIVRFGDMDYPSKFLIKVLDLNTCLFLLKNFWKLF